MSKLGGDRTSAQSSILKKNFCNSGQKLRRSSYQSFLLLSSFTWFLYLCSNILSRIVCLNKFVYNSGESFSNFNILIFVSLQSFSQIFDTDMTCGGCRIITKVTRKLFLIFDLDRKVSLQRFRLWLVVSFR